MTAASANALNFGLRLLSVWVLSVFLAQPVFSEKAPSSSGMEFFEKKVRPVLATHCYQCHGPQLQQGDLRLDSREGILKGGSRGPTVVPGKPEVSWLMKAVRHQGLTMPPSGQLMPEQIAVLADWIEMGAPWFHHPIDQIVSKGTDQLYTRMAREHWAFQPVTKPEAPPIVFNSSSNLVDQFIQEKLKEKGLEQAGGSDRWTLARRLSLVLTGLPLSPWEVDRFVQDSSPDAYERLVDRLLASPHFGERWARHWTDLVRFGETYGYEWNYELLAAWRYRDYLVRAFNQDLPFDQLIREHVAGDLLETPRIDQQLGINESLTGATFFRLGEMSHDDCVKFREIRTDVVDNQIDTLTKAFQGLTVACARCHDHKLDPIPTKDYYALYGILASSRQVSRTLDTGDLHRELKQRLHQLKSLIRAELASHWIKQCVEIGPYLLAAQAMQNQENSYIQRIVDLEPRKVQRWSQLLMKESVDPEGVLYPWTTIACEIDLTSKRFKKAWSKLGAYYQRESQARTDFNRKNFLNFTDFRSGHLNGWHSDGIGIQGGTTNGGELIISTKGSQVVTGILPSGIYTHLLSDRLNGALRSPYLPKDKKFLSLRLMGGQLAAHRTIVDHCVLGEDYKILQNEVMSWVRIPIKYKEESFPVYVELVTKSGNLRLPDRPGFIKGYQLKDLEKPGSYFGISQAVLHDVHQTPREGLSHMVRLFRGGAPKSAEELASRYATACRQALIAWSGATSNSDDVHWIGWMLRNDLLPNKKELSPRLKQLVQTYRNFEGQLPEPQVISSMSDLDPGYDVPLLENGDAKRPREQIPRGYLTVLSNEDPGFETLGSGRRELAENIASASNPLTARVMVNRLWHHIFGRGIVTTVDNFGRFGERPSHPELLNYLANRFVENDWSIKRLLRLLVLSTTFRASSSTSVQARNIDPLNQWLQHYPVRRLEAEAIRDTILATSGRLERKFYGSSIQPFRKVPKDYRKLLSGPLDGGGRRSLYLKVTRMEGPQFLELFDFPAPAATRGSRDRTNIPSQALALLNDAFVIDQSGYWADYLLIQPDQSLERRLESMFHSALGRPPEAAEVKRFKGFAIKLADLHGISTRNILGSRKVWKDLAHTMFNLKEFIYIH